MESIDGSRKEGNTVSYTLRSLRVAAEKLQFPSFSHRHHSSSCIRKTRYEEHIALILHQSINMMLSTMIAGGDFKDESQANENFFCIIVRYHLQARKNRLPEVRSLAFGFDN